MKLENSTLIALLACIAAVPATISIAHADAGESFDDGIFAMLPMEGEDPQERPIVPERPYAATRPAADTAPTTAPVDGLQVSSPGMLGDLGGRRATLEAHGITVAPTLTLDFGKNLRGGVDTSGSAVDSLFNLPVTLDTAAAGGWAGGTFYVNFQIQHGASPSDEIGDYQAVSNLTADGRTQLSELWFQQVSSDGTLAIKLGKIDVNGDFGFAENAGAFMNGSMGFPLSNLLMPTYPDPAFGVELFVNPTGQLYGSVGLFDGALAEGYRTGSRGPQTLFGGPADLYAIAEVGATWTFADGALPGRVRVGGWFHTGTFDRYDGDTQDGVAGGYVIVDQRLYRENASAENDDQGLLAFAEFDAGDARVLEVERHASAGLVWIGALPGRDADAIGLGVTAAHFNDAAAAAFVDGDEVTVELFYQVQVTPFLTIKPDLQYVANPGGTGAADAIAALIRVELNF